MKKSFLLIPVFIYTLTQLTSCSKDITERTANTPALTPAKTDLDAGTWKPILLSSATEFPVAAPIATNSPDYVAQVNEIKSWQNNLSADERAMVKYWSAGAVFRY